jgi:hypothetical protein
VGGKERTEEDVRASDALFKIKVLAELAAAGPGLACVLK